MNRINVHTLSLSIDFRVLEGFHTCIVETIWFHHVNYVESVLLILPSVGDRKVEPLRMNSSEVIRLQNEVVFVITS
jgi:hypothetical protein